MTSAGLIAALSALILAILLGRAIWVLRQEKDQGRGSLPGKGDHIIEANYFSGGGGGGHQTTFRVPRDPQDYAKRFVPKERERQE